MNPKLLNDPRAFIPYWFEQKKVKIEGNLILSAQGEKFETSIVMDSMWLDYRGNLRDVNENLDRPIRGFPEADFKKAIGEFIEIKRREELTALRNKIALTNTDRTELERFLIATTGKIDPVEIAVLSHLIWQTKRKVFGKKSKDHMMVIFKGRQGAGKTEAIRRLFSVLKGWLGNASLAEITDDRWKYFLRTRFVIFCDELQHADRANVDALKNIISSEDLDTRRLGGNIYDVVSQNCSFVGATNKPIAELIRDTTGMRRFFQIDTLERMNWAEINSIDFLRIWQSIDENREPTYIDEFKLQINEIQSTLIIREPEEEFLEQFKLLSGASDTRTKFITNAEIYSIYSKFVRDNGERQKPSNSFHRKVKGLGLRDFEERQGSNGTRGYRISEESLQSMTLYRTQLSSNY